MAALARSGVSGHRGLVARLRRQSDDKDAHSGLTLRALARRLAAADPSNATSQRDLSYSLMTLAQLHAQQGNRLEAIRAAEESLAIDERLAALDATNAVWQHDVKVSRALVARLRG